MYLKDNELLPVPFNKGIGICLMKIDTYLNNKMRDIIELPQFRKFTVNRKDGKIIAKCVKSIVVAEKKETEEPEDNEKACTRCNSR